MKKVIVSLVLVAMMFAGLRAGAATVVKEGEYDILNAKGEVNVDKYARYKKEYAAERQKQCQSPQT